MSINKYAIFHAMQDNGYACRCTVCICWDRKCSSMGEMDSEREARVLLEQYKLLDVEETGKDLGDGSFSAVVNLKYMGLQCAGTKIHKRVVCDEDSDALLWRFLEACSVRNKLRHPHIVQFIGVYAKQDCILPIIVSESLPTTLTQCLDRYGVLRPVVIYSILRDVALALAYMHGQLPPILHRDLTANNVLLSSSMTAKLADVGVARIVDWRPAEMDRPPMCKRRAHLPPEMFKPDATFTKLVDIFSYGVLTIHILSGRLPVPNNTSFTDEDVPNASTGSFNLQRSLSISEADCLPEFLSEIGDHPLTDTIHNCLKRSPSLRPPMSETLQLVSDLASRNPIPFSNGFDMLRQIEADDEEKSTLRREIQRLASNGTPDKPQLSEVEQLRLKVAKLSAQNYYLHATLHARTAAPVVSSKSDHIMEKNGMNSTDSSNKPFSPVQVGA